MQSDARKDGRQGFILKRSENTFFSESSGQLTAFEPKNHQKMYRKICEINLPEFEFKMLPSDP